MTVSQLKCYPDFVLIELLPWLWHFFPPTDNGVCAVKQIGEHLVKLDAGQHRRRLLSGLERLLEVGADLKQIDNKTG